MYRSRNRRDNNVNHSITLRATRENLDRIEEQLTQKDSDEDDLDPKNPLNKVGVNLSRRGIEVCYRLFDEGKTRYAVKRLLDISYGAATHRFHAWEKLGGKNRKREPLD
ncbi:MAG: hypothetical protein WBF58_01845 [Xanthobacteraceae bacterium]